LDNFTYKFKYSKIYLGGAGTQTAGLAFGGFYQFSTLFSSNRRMDRCRSSNKNNNGKLIWQNI
jgi:hypothetical protein